jgi:hypothetical protein
MYVFVFVYLPTDLSLTDNFHKFQLKIEKLKNCMKLYTAKNGEKINFARKKIIIINLVFAAHFLLSSISQNMNNYE